MIVDWVFGAVAVLTLLHGSTLLYAYRRGAVAGGHRVTNTTLSVTDDSVECPNCGEHNERGYRFCRHCVSELPAATSFFGPPSAPASRRTL
jgi:hypothetical protein